MTWRAYRADDGFQIGWMSGRWWLSLASLRGTYWLDVGTFRIRWTGRDYRPLFSERYGYQKWHKIGRLAVNHNARRSGISK